VAERATLRLVQEQGHGHEMIMPQPQVLALVRRKKRINSIPGRLQWLACPRTGYPRIGLSLAGLVREVEGWAS
jgi:hypothetical protein